MNEWLRRIGGLLIILAFVLPLSECESQRKVGLDTAKPEVVETVTTVHYPYNYISPDNIEGVEDIAGSLLFLTLFFWPLATLLYFVCRKKRIIIQVVSVIEIALCFCSAYFIWEMATIIGTPLYGAYVILIGTFLYLVSVLIEVVKSRFYKLYDAS